MTFKWPSERISKPYHSLDTYSIDPQDEFNQFLLAYPAGLPIEFDMAVTWIIQGGNSIVELERRMTDVCKTLDLDGRPEKVSFLMVWSCAKALATSPLIQTWQTVRMLSSNSNQLEQFLTDAMLVYACEVPTAKDAYVSLARETFCALDNDRLESQFKRYNDKRQQLKMAWHENVERLVSLWLGLRDECILLYEEEFPLFKVLNVIDPSGFVSLLAISSNPYLVNSALWATGAFDKFCIWEELACSAPTAFDKDGIWSSSVFLPLLLVMARDKVVQSCMQVSHAETLEVKEAAVKQEICDCSEAVIAVLVKRNDAMPLFTRWSAWLMRQLLTQGFKKATDIHSSAMADDALLDAIGCQLKNQKLNTVPTPDAPAWECWCYLAVLSSFAHSKFISVPNCDGFLEEWEISADEWTVERGKQLRERCNLFLGLNRDIPGDAANCLAYPIAMSESSVDKWIKLWNASLSLREIVEFGDVDALKTDEHQSRSEAGRMQFFVFCMGLSILDQSVERSVTSDSLLARNLTILHSALESAVREMLEIDDSFNRKKWLQALQHLAIRRLLWENNDDFAKENNSFSIFLPGDTPTFCDYLTAASNDELELLSILQTTLLHFSNHKAIREKINEASIDLGKVIETLKRLHSIGKGKYFVDESQLRSLVTLNEVDSL